MSFIKINDFQPNYMQSIAESRVQYFCSCVFETLPDYLYKVEATDRSKNHCTPLLWLWYTHPPPKLLKLLTSRSSPWAMRKLPKGLVFIVLLSPVYWSASRNQRICTMSIPRQAIHIKWTFVRFKLLPRCLRKPKQLMQLKSWKRPSQRCRATLFPDDSRSTAWSAMFVSRSVLSGQESQVLPRHLHQWLNNSNDFIYMSKLAFIDEKEGIPTTSDYKSWGLISDTLVDIWDNYRRQLKKKKKLAHPDSCRQDNRCQTPPSTHWRLQPLCWGRPHCHCSDWRYMDWWPRRPRIYIRKRPPSSGCL